LGDLRDSGSAAERTNVKARRKIDDLGAAVEQEIRRVPI